MKLFTLRPWVITLLICLGCTFGLELSAQNVGIGVPAPQQRLDVDGWLRLADETAGGANLEGSVRYNSGGYLEFHDGTAWQQVGQGIVRGNVDAATATINSGGGFTVVSTGTGENTITFGTPFTTPPTVVVTPMAAPAAPTGGGGGPYCTPSFGDCGALPDDHIINVTIGAINNTTGPAPCPDSYDDFTALSTNVVPGNSYPISVTFDSDGTWTQFVTVFFDWNQDGDFTDPGEELQLGSGIDATLTGTVNVPLTAIPGNVTMRVIEEYNVYTTSDGCNSDASFYGETEDYTLVVSGGGGGGAPPAASVSNVTNTGCDVHLFQSNDGIPTDYEYSIIIVGE